MKKETKRRIITIFILLMFLGSSLTYAIISAFPSGQANNSSWVARIVIVINGESYPIPADIGFINNETKAKVYTVDTEGTIMKSVSEDVTLKDFFIVWNQTFNSTCILDYCNTNSSSMKMYVYQGNNKVENSEYELYTIKNNDVIIIDYR